MGKSKKMKLANNINIRVFCKKDEDVEKIKQGLLTITTLTFNELEKDKIKITKSEASGFDEKITIFELFLEKDRHINKTLENIKEKLTEKDKSALKTQENRLDEHLDFYLRLLKPSILEDFFELTDSGDCYHIKINVAAFPKNKEVVKQKINEIFT